MSKFRKKPVVIEAHQFGGTIYSADAIIAWAGIEPRPNEQNLDYSVTDNEGTFRDRIEQPAQFGPLVIHTLEGDMTAQEGDWIIKGVKGEFYPCKPDIFAATYEPVEGPQTGNPPLEPS